MDTQWMDMPENEDERLESLECNRSLAMLGRNWAWWENTLVHRLALTEYTLVQMPQGRSSGCTPVRRG